MELIVFPTRELVKQYKSSQLQGEKGVTGQPPVTYDLFIEKCITKKIADKTLLGDFKKNIVIEHIMYRLKHKLKYFKNIFPGYIYKMGEVIGELKRQDIDPETFKKLVSSSHANRDIYLIYKTYEDFLKNNNLYDRESRYLFCKDVISTNSYIKNFNLILFNDFYELSVIQKKIIDALEEKAKLFNSTPMIEPKKMHIVKARDRKTEVWALAHRILEDIDLGLLPENICIVLRERELYQSLIEEVFKKVGICVDIEKQDLLIKNPFIKAFLLLGKKEISCYFDGEIPFDESKKMTYAKWVEFIAEFFHQHKYPEKFCDVHKGDLDFVYRDLQAYEALCSLMEDMAYIDMVFPGKEINFESFRGKIEEFSKGYSYNYGSRQKNGIWVLAPAMLRGLKFDKIYCLGMAEGEFPKDFRPDWLLKDEERENINSQGYLIDTIDLLLKRERESFEFIMSCSKELYLSYPAVNEDGLMILPSIYLEKAAEMVKDCKQENIDFASVYYCETLKKANLPISGNIKDKKTLAQINKSYRDYSFSVTALNTYGECPYKFFLSRVLKLQEDISDSFVVSRGAIYHKILEIFFTRHREKLELEKINSYAEEIQEITFEILEDTDFCEHFPHQKLFELEINEIIYNITSYVEYHIKNCGHFSPYLMEFGFGYHEKFQLDPNSKIKLCGKIDRIDINPEEKLVVFDYKTGSIPSVDDIKSGTDLQMPVYIIAAQTLLNKEVLGGAYISLKDAKVDNVVVRERNLPFISKRKKKGIFEQNQWDQMLNEVRLMIISYVNNIRNAQFPMEPKKCPKMGPFKGFCDFAQVCSWEGGEE